MSEWLCAVDDIPEGGSRGFPAPDGTTGLLAVKRNGAVWLYRNQCPHLGVELDWLPDQFLNHDGEFIQCAMHGALFEIETGLCIAGPCIRQSLITVAATIRNGQVYLEAPC